MRKFPRFFLNRDFARLFTIASTGVLLAFALVACARSHSADTQPLDNSGMSYSSVKQLDSMSVSSAEIQEILTAHNAGFSDDDCVQIVQVFHRRGQPFKSGDAVAALLQAGMDDQTILGLANLNELGSTYGEYEAMHLAGLSDAIVLAVAERRSGNKPVLSGASLAGLKNTGLRSTTLLELARHGVPDTETNAIISFRRRGASDSQILRRFAGS